MGYIVDFEVKQLVYKKYYINKLIKNTTHVIDKVFRIDDIIFYVGIDFNEVLNPFKDVIEFSKYDSSVFFFDNEESAELFIVTLKMLHLANKE